jgi:phospholipid transport system transporter-binding protein
MAEPRIEETGHGSWLLVGDLSFTTVPALRGELDMKSADRPRISIDLAGVTRSDSAGLALLIEWLRESERLGKTITFLNMPAQMQSIARICGLDGILPADIAAPPPPTPVPAPATGEPPRRATPRRRNRKARR